MHVQQLMTRPVISCRWVETLNTAAQLMWEHDCGAIPILGDDGRLLGIVTDRDACMAAYTQGKPLHAIPVTAAMTKQVFSCLPAESIEAAERLMTEKQVRRLPVIDHDGRPVGIVSLNDIAREAASARKKRGLEREAIRTLAAISRPRRTDIQESISRAQANIVPASF